MADVHVTQDPVAVYAIVAVMGALVVIALLFSFFGARMPKAPTKPGPPPETGDPNPSVSTGTWSTNSPELDEELSADEARRRELARNWGLVEHLVDNKPS